VKHDIASICLALALPLLLIGCSDVMLAGGADGDEELAAASFPEFDGATLQVSEPVSGTIVLLDEGLALEAEVVSASGTTMDFDAIVLTTDQHEDVLL